VPQSVIDDIRDIMPSKNLVIHEYRAHGTCSGLAPDQYFGLARDLYERVGIPPRARPSAHGPRALGDTLTTG
jgi:ribonuclease T2